MRKILTTLFLFTCCYIYGQNQIVISKQDMTLFVLNQEDTLFKAPIACGVGYGNKVKKNDGKTPEGVFSIISIEDSRNWIYTDENGVGHKNVYGKAFLRLKVPKFTSIGIHGTNEPLLIGKRVSHGCVRLNNNDLEQLLRLVVVGTSVTITPSLLDSIANL